MNPYLEDPDVTIHVGDALGVLRGLPDGSVDCCITSPPFWGLRDYGVEGQLGLEATPEEYVARMVEVFREVRRVLAPHGTVWLNLGDSYATHRNDSDWLGGQGGQLAEVKKGNHIPAGLKQKDLCGIPWRVAFALQADGWYLRSDIIWSKPNPMPESVTDRPTKAHEYVFLLSKGPRYFFDQEAVREPAEWRRWGDQTTPKHEGTDTGSSWIKPRAKSELTPRNDGDRWNEADGRGFTPNPAGRNVRSVWEIATRPFPEAHFATYPPELVRRCLLAGCPERVCGTCGKPSERIVATTHDTGSPKSERDFYGDGRDPGVHRKLGSAYQRKLDATERISSWSDCGHNDYRPGVALDPFLGSGTTALVAREQSRRCVGIELNEEYAAMAARRLGQLSLLAETA